jgi:hypothetical protein
MNEDKRCMFYDTEKLVCTHCYKSILDSGGVCSIKAKDLNAEIFDSVG